MPTVVRVNTERDIQVGAVVLPAAAVSWRFDRDGGPGGQHRNKVHTRATATVDLGRLEGPCETVERIRGRLGTRLVVSEGASRSQWRNRVQVVDRIKAELENVSKPARTRRKTRPSASATQRRLETKHRVARRKRERRRVDDHE